MRLERQFGREITAWMLRELRRTVKAAQNGNYHNPSDEELAQMLLPRITDAATRGAEQGLLPLIEMSMNFDPHEVNRAAAEFARQHVYHAYGEFDRGLAAMLNETTRKAAQKEVSAWIAEPNHKQADLAKRLAPTFGPDRARTIAVTEITNAYAGGAIAGWRDANRQAGTTVITGKQWATANDERVCPICAPLGGLLIEGSITAAQSEEVQAAHAQVTGLGDVFTHPGGGGLADKFRGQTYYRPPAHPRCRCWVVPVVEEIPANG